MEKKIKTTENAIKIAFEDVKVIRIEEEASKNFTIEDEEIQDIK
jgi:hypothetical protein